MPKKYALIHKDDGEILRLSDSPPVINGDVVRFPDGEMRGVKWEKIRVAEIDCDHDLPDPALFVSEEEDLTRLRVDSTNTKIWIGDKSVPASVNDFIPREAATPEDLTTAKAELARISLEKVLKTAYPNLWNSYSNAVTQAEKAETQDDLTAVLYDFVDELEKEIT